MLRTSLVRSAAPALRSAKTTAPVCVRVQRRCETTATAHAISNPTLANIEKRWEAMPPQEQADLWMALRDRMKTNWHDLTVQEKKAAYWIAFGAHGPRAQAPPGEGLKVFSYTLVGCGVAFALFAAARFFAKPPPRTMTREYQEMSDEYLKNQKTEVIRGGTQVQSAPAKK